MAKIDFFVHPFYIEPDNMNPTQKLVFQSTQIQYQKYCASIEQVLQASSNPVLLTPTKRSAHEEEFKQQFIDENILLTEGEVDIDYGYVTKSDFDKLRVILEQVELTDDIRIHGSFMDECTKETAQQIYQFFKENCIDCAFSALYGFTGGLQKSGIRYGTVLSPNIAGVDEKFAASDSNWVPFELSKHPLIDSETQIYGRPEPVTRTPTRLPSFIRAAAQWFLPNTPK